MKKLLLLLMAICTSMVFAQEKPARQMPYTATINGQNILTIDANNTETLVLEITQPVSTRLEKNSSKVQNPFQREAVKKSEIKKDKIDHDAIDFKVVYEVVSYKLKIPGQPTQNMEGNELDLSKYSQFMKSGESWNIFNIAIVNPKDPAKTPIEGQTVPVVIDIQ